MCKNHSLPAGHVPLGGYAARENKKHPLPAGDAARESKKTLYQQDMLSQSMEMINLQYRIFTSEIDIIECP